MKEPYYVISSRGWPHHILVGIGRLANCDCDAHKKKLKRHRKTCASYYNFNLRYKLSLWEKVKSCFLPAEKIFGFYDFRRPK